MKLGILEYVDRAVNLVESNMDRIQAVSYKLNQFFVELTKGCDYCLNVTDRVKSKDSFKEKVIRQNYFKRYQTPGTLLANFSDLIGLRLECRFNDDEERLYHYLKTKFTVERSNGLFSSPLNPCIQLNLTENQPLQQKNGFPSYRIDGIYSDHGWSINFELQIKSLVNVFWSEIDHRILYKNYSYLARTGFVSEMMYSIKENLNLIDKQMHVVYDQIVEIEHPNTDPTKDQLKNLMMKMIHDQYAPRIREDVGIMVDFRQSLEVLVNYIFAKVEYDTEENFAIQFTLIAAQLQSLGEGDRSFGESIIYDQMPQFKNRYCKQIGEKLVEIVNTDFNWNLLIHILGDLDTSNPVDEFMNFVEYLVFEVIKTIRSGVAAGSDDPEMRKNWEEEITDFVFDAYTSDLDPRDYTRRNLGILGQEVEHLVQANVGFPKGKQRQVWIDRIEMRKKEYQNEKMD